MANDEGIGNFKPGTLAVRWRKNPDGNGPDLVYFYPDKPDGHMLNCFFSYSQIGDSTLIDQLEKRGYDISTLQFTIRKKSNE